MGRHAQTMAARRVDFPFPRGSSTHSRRSGKHLPNDLPLDGSKSRFRNSPQNRLNRSSSVARPPSGLFGVAWDCSSCQSLQGAHQFLGSAADPDFEWVRGADSTSIARGRRLLISGVAPLDPMTAFRGATCVSRGIRTSDRINDRRETREAADRPDGPARPSSTVTLMTCLRGTLGLPLREILRRRCRRRTWSAFGGTSKSQPSRTRTGGGSPRRHRAASSSAPRRDQRELPATVRPRDRGWKSDKRASLAPSASASRACLGTT